MYLSNGGEPNLDGEESLFSVTSNEVLIISLVSIGIYIWIKDKHGKIIV